MALEIRKPVVASMFYPFDADELKSQIENFISNIDNNIIDSVINKNIKAIVSPHAGYIYSGQTASYSYKAVAKSKPDIVVVIGPSHREYLGGSSVYSGDIFQTPLGDIKIAKELCEKISDNSSNIFYSKKGHQLEHSIEVQIPFLQYVYGNNFKLIPIVMSDYSLEHIEKLANRLKNVLAPFSNVLFVASSDLSHYKNVDIAKKMDLNLADLLEKGDVDSILFESDKGEIEACGLGPILVVMKYFNNIKFKKLFYDTSATVTLDSNKVVGYLSGVFYE